LRRGAQYGSKLQRLVGAMNSPDHIAIINILRSIRRNAGHGSGEFNELAHLSIAMCRQCHDRNAAELLQCKIKIGKLDDIRQLHNHSVEWLEPFVEQI
jgi:hypothetical protein